MDERNSVIKENGERAGQYDGGLQALVKSLKWAFGFLLVVIAGMLIYFFTAGGYFTVEPQHAVLVFKFGKFEQIYTTGGHWFLPYPVNRWVRVMTNQQSLRVRFMPEESVEGADATGPLNPGSDGYLFTGDANIIHNAWVVTYHISNPGRYYASLATPPNPLDDDLAVIDAEGYIGGRGPQTLLRNLFRQAATEVTAALKVDDIFGANQGSYSAAIKRDFSALVADLDVGIEIDNVTLERLMPPLRTKPAFDEVAAASNSSATQINQAMQYEVKVRNDMLTQESAMIAEADTYRSRVVSEMKAETAYFKTINEEYRKSPRTVLMALYNNALADVLGAQQGKFILGSGNAPGAKRRAWIKLNPIPNRRGASETAATQEEK